MTKCRVVMLVVIIGLYLLMSALLAWYVYDHPGKDQDAIVEMAKMLFVAFSGLGIVLATFFSILQSHDAIKMNRSNKTVEVILAWDEPTLAEARKQTKKITSLTEKKTPEQIMALIRQDPEYGHALVRVFNYYDLVRIALKTKVVNRDIVALSVRDLFETHYRVFQPWISEQTRGFQGDLIDLKRLLAEACPDTHS